MIVKLNRIFAKKKIEMKLKYKLYQAKFIERPNRFLTKLNYNGLIINSHLPDPGRLTDLLIPGSRVLIKKENNKKRKTKYSTQAVFYKNILVSLNTLLPNQIIEYLIINKKLNFLNNYKINKKEIKYDNHRFDFQLRNKNKLLLVEVKSVTLANGSTALFPDSITKRGQKHIQLLGQLTENGQPSMIIFVVQRSDTKLFKPNWNIDPNFCSSLLQASKKGLIIKVISMEIKQDSIIYKGEIPFNLKR